MTDPSTEHSFCAACGIAWPSGARFCSACGTGAATAAAKPATARPATSRQAAVIVFVGITAAGLVAAYAALRSGGSAERAVPGTPGGAPTGSARAQTATGGMPPDHPPIDLPAEVVSFIDDLAKSAAAAPEDIEAWKKLARARYRAGMINPTYYTGAREALARVRQLQPKDTETIRMSANIAYDIGEFADAEKLFREYLEIDPDDPSARTDLGSTVLFQGRADEARQMYADVIASHPDFAQAHLNLGIALHNEGRRDEAMKALKRARELAKEPQDQQRVDQIIAAAEGRAPDSEARAAGAGSPPRAVPQGAGNAPAPSNAASDFQKGVDRLFAEHPIVGPRVARIEWTGGTTAKVHLPGFPMDQMPAVVRNKFKSTMNERIAGLLTGQSQSDVNIELVGQGDHVMDKLDAKELIGAFAQPPEG